MHGGDERGWETDWFVVLGRNPGRDCGVLGGRNIRGLVWGQVVDVCARGETQRHVGDHHRRRQRRGLKGRRRQWRGMAAVAARSGGGMVVGGEGD